MENIDLYLNIIDANDIINNIMYIGIGCIIINLIISTISNFKNDKAEEKIEKKVKFGIVEIIGYIILLSLLICFILPILKNTLITTILAIPSYILLFSIIYIKPMIDNKLTTFKFDYYSYGAILVFSLYCLINMDFETSFLEISREGELQVICIIILLFELYFSVYCLMLNAYFVIKNLNKLGINNLEKNYNELTNKLYDILGFDKINLEFTFSNRLIKNSNKKRKLFLFIPNFILDIICCFFKYIFSIIFSFILSPILIIIRFIISKITKLSKTNENQINYGITKVVSTFAIIIVYILLQMNEVFQPRIIATYEFIASVILIPIILEGLLSLKEQLKKKSQEA